MTEAMVQYARRSARRATWRLVAALALTAASAASASDWGPVTIGKEVIAPGAKHKFTILGDRSFEGAFIDFVVFAARGASTGPTLCVTSGIHGDEINSVEIARRVFAQVDAAEMRGTLVVLPAVNASGFRTMDRYLPDRRDLNRAFPGSADGSVAAILADVVFSLIRGCSHLVDLHTGSNFRTNLPQIRVDADDAEALGLARSFGVGIIVSGAGPAGSLRQEAMDIGIPSLIFESGPPYVFVEADIEQGARGVGRVMAHLGMVDAADAVAPARVLTRSAWIRVPRGKGGIYLPRVRLGDQIVSGQLLATITDPVTDVAHEVRGESGGVVVGMALPQVVLSGYGLIHLGELSD